MAEVTDLTLFDLAASEDAPRCRLCVRPAWRRGSGEYHLYCSSGSCTNRERLCQTCGRTFPLNIDGAGTKYCSTDCKRVGYQPLRSAGQCCAWCGKRAKYRVNSGITWPYVCNSCVAPIKHLVPRLKSHKVPHDVARRLLDDPGCEVCGRDIVTKTRDPNTGRIRSLLTVDHDHKCCPGAKSCGLCVRGLLCTQCNCAAGLLGDGPARARSLASYLDRFI